MSTALKHVPQTTTLPPAPAALSEACRTFEVEAGGRESLVQHLAHARLTKQQDRLVRAIADPRNDAASLAQICMLAGMQFADLLQMFRDAGFVQAQLKAMQRVWALVPDLAEDVMTRALPHQLPCGTCGGSGEVEEKVRDGKNEAGEWKWSEVKSPCGVCRGKGEILVQPGIDQQKLALEMSGLVGRAAGPVTNVNVSQKVGVGVSLGAGGDLFSMFLQESDEEPVNTSERVEVVDAEVSKPEAEPQGEAEEGAESAAPEGEFVPEPLLGDEEPV